MLVLLLAIVSIISGILAVAGLPSAVDFCDVPIVSAAMLNVLVTCEFLLLMLVSLLNVAIFSTKITPFGCRCYWLRPHHPAC
jgi:hypothetical protein